MKTAVTKGQLLVQNTIDSFKNQAGTNSFTLSPSKWIEATGAIGIRSTAGLIYASEADVLNMALFGITAKQWREQNNTKQGNMRDHASVQQLIILSNMESINAELIRQSISQSERLLALNNTAIHQMRSLLGAVTVLKIK